MIRAFLAVSNQRTSTCMLAALDVRTGMSVLEIGTGSGYNAALLASQLGAQRVTTIEVDPRLAGYARQALTATGL